MLTNPWARDPRTGHGYLAEPPRPLLPLEHDRCPCGCTGLHEVARRNLTDGGALVVLSDGCHRLYAPGCIGADVEVWDDRFGAPSRDLLAWASVYDCDEVREQLLALAWVQNSIDESSRAG